MKIRIPPDCERVPVVFDLEYAAMLFGVKYQTLVKYAQQGKFPAHKIFNSWRVDKEEAKQFLLNN